ncbi:cobalamin B12-binding domain-containing protein [Rubrivivax gelatinosus]|uniref:Methanogenic corrinoid protein MtbC1 n=1 Tax=Rubrivivax gelatinosus TaxID=28068 RepID=A0A4R2MLN8_RUBGE|nr:cobalamin-dependent protein [Rubrivivax gelatinosus]MBK1686039.1 cobalamin-binding protein [Rubrivivax gelatinosus]TCP03936.1 methanogenic corrinoid protein MtbC1 [Rubrivivax gelatinosus]
MSPAACAARVDCPATVEDVQAVVTEARVPQHLARLARSIEGEVVPLLSRAVRVDPAATLSPDDLARFIEFTLAPGDAGWLEMVGALRERGVPVELIYLDLLAPAARRLGEMWEQDLVMFSDVTVALGRLHRIMRGLSPSLGHDLHVPVEGRRALLLPAPGEQHTFGLSMVAEFFRHAGWEVVCELDSRSIDPVRRVRREWFDVVGVSVGVDARLDWLRDGITMMRRASRNRGMSVIVGGPVFALHPERAAEAGADGTARDAREAPVLASRLVAAKAGKR